MIYYATRKIERAAKEKELRYSIDETDTSSVLNIGFDGDVAKNLKIRFISRDDDNDFSVRCFSIANAPEAKVDAVLKVLNDANNDYRFAKFVLDKDNDINVEYDFPQEGSDIGEAAMELVVRFVSIIDRVYPKLMAAIWG